jgi:hypothetical protein
MQTVRTVSLRLARLAGLLVAAAVAVGACAATPTAADKLTADQVRQTFVGREWTQGTGTFLFGTDGNWRYADSSTNVGGTYELAPDGVLCSVTTGSGLRTCYTFYRAGSGYQYYHDRSGRYWPATPR